MNGPPATAPIVPRETSTGPWVVVRPPVTRAQLTAELRAVAEEVRDVLQAIRAAYKA